MIFWSQNGRDIGKKMILDIGGKVIPICKPIMKNKFLSYLDNNKLSKPLPYDENNDLMASESFTTSSNDISSSGNSSRYSDNGNYINNSLVDMRISDSYHNHNHNYHGNQLLSSTPNAKIKEINNELNEINKLKNDVDMDKMIIDYVNDGDEKKANADTSFGKSVRVLNNSFSLDAEGSSKKNDEKAVGDDEHSKDINKQEKNIEKKSKTDDEKNLLKRKSQIGDNENWSKKQRSKPITKTKCILCVVNIIIYVCVYVSL